MSRRSWSMLLVLAAMWGASYLFIKIGLRDLSPAMVVFARVALSAAILLPIAAAKGAFAPLRGLQPTIALLAAIQVVVPFLLIARGEEEIASSLTGILVGSTPIFTALLAIWIDHEERSRGLRLVGVAVGIVGVAVLLGVDLSGTTAALLGGLAVVLASLGYAIGSFIVKHRLADAPQIGLVASVMAWSSAMALAPALLSEPLEVPSAGPAAAVVALAVLGTVVSFVIFYALIASDGPAKAALVTYIAPAFAVVYGAVFLDEAITAGSLTGLVLIVAGSWLAAGGSGEAAIEAAGSPQPPGEAAAQPDSAPRRALSAERREARVRAPGR